MYMVVYIRCQEPGSDRASRLGHAPARELTQMRLLYTRGSSVFDSSIPQKGPSAQIRKY